MEFHRVGGKADLPIEGEAREFEVGNRTVCIANVDGEFCAMSNVCAHHGGPLGQGVVSYGKVVCPWHGWSFDAKTGEADQNPKLKVDVYAMKIEGEDVLVEM